MSSMLSRSGRTDPGGNLTDRIDVPVSDEIVFGKLRMTQMLSQVGRSDQGDEHGRNIG